MSIWGKSKESFWQQSYTDLVRYVILLYRVRDGYLTLVDHFRTVISSARPAIFFRAPLARSTRSSRTQVQLRLQLHLS
jgi:hypothetical protein